MTDTPAAPASVSDTELPAAELVDLLNEAFEVELDRRRAQLAGAATVAEPDAGVSAARGVLIAGAMGVVVWAGIIALLVALA